MYNASEFIKSSNQKMGVGIHPECALESVVLTDGYIDYNYVSAVGEVNNKRVWTPTAGKVYVKENETDAQALERKKKEYLAFLVRHMQIFCPKEVVDTFSAPTFEDFAKRGAELLNQYKDSCKVNLKLIPDADLEYSTFPNFPSYIERYEEGKEPRLKFSQWEIDNRLKPFEIKKGLANSDSGSLGDLV